MIHHIHDWTFIPFNPRSSTKRTGRKPSRPATKAKASKTPSSNGDVISPAEAKMIAGKSTAAEGVPHPDQCICTICSCGAHKCPPDRVQGKYTDLKSSYMQDFTGAYVKPEKIARPQYVHKPRPFDGTTTMKVTLSVTAHLYINLIFSVARSYQSCWAHLRF